VDEHHEVRSERIAYVFVPGWISNLDFDTQMFEGLEFYQEGTSHWVRARAA
jgi:hypothetical protein